MSRHAVGTRPDGMPARPLVEWYWARRRAMTTPLPAVPAVVRRLELTGAPS